MPPWLSVLLQLLAGLGGLAAVLLSAVTRSAISAYGGEKGKNLATQEDVAKITRLIEEVRTAHAADLERLKVALTATATVHKAQYEAEMATYVAVWEKLVTVHRSLHALRDLGVRAAEQPDPEGQETATAQNFAMAVAAYRAEVEQRRPFCPEAVYIELQALDDMVTALNWSDVPIPAAVRRSPHTPNYVDLDVVLEQADRICNAIRQRLAHVAFEALPLDASRPPGVLAGVIVATTPR